MKSKFIPRLTSFLYDICSHINPTVHIRGGSITEGSGRKRKLLFNINNKENLDPQTIPNRKTEKWVKRNII